MFLLDKEEDMVPVKQERLYIALVLCIAVIVVLLRPTWLGVACAALIAVALLTFLESAV